MSAIKLLIAKPTTSVPSFGKKHKHKQKKIETSMFKKHQRCFRLARLNPALGLEILVHLAW